MHGAAGVIVAAFAYWYGRRRRRWRREEMSTSMQKFIFGQRRDQRIVV